MGRTKKGGLEFMLNIPFSGGLSARSKSTFLWVWAYAQSLLFGKFERTLNGHFLRGLSVRSMAHFRRVWAYAQWHIFVEHFHMGKWQFSNPPTHPSVENSILFDGGWAVLGIPCSLIDWLILKKLEIIFRVFLGRANPPSRLHSSSCFFFKPSLIHM